MFRMEEVFKLYYLVFQCFTRFWSDGKAFPVSGSHFLRVGSVDRIQDYLFGFR